MTDAHSQPIRMTAMRPGMSAERDDRVVVEEPLEIRVAGEAIAVTMRTPGHDEELAAGFLFTEGVVQQSEQIAGAAHASTPRGDPAPNIVEIRVSAGVIIDLERAQRTFYATSSCGICGKASIEQVRQRVRPIESSLRISRELITALPDKMRDAQRVFGQTGGLHAAALFTPGGELICLREDVGRHNAVDKVIGWAVLQRRLPLDDHILLISGRASFEIVQKALVARIPLVAAVSAPSSLALDLARENQMTLIGFLRGDTMDVYAGSERIV
jgi:FdhD protein